MKSQGKLGTHGLLLAHWFLGDRARAARLLERLLARYPDLSKST